MATTTVCNPYSKPQAKKRKTSTGTLTSKTTINPISSSKVTPTPQSNTTNQLATVRKDGKLGGPCYPSPSPSTPIAVETISPSAVDSDDDSGNNFSPESPAAGTGSRTRFTYPNRDKDFSSANVNKANLKLDIIYGDHIRENSGHHLHGGIGAAQDMLW